VNVQVISRITKFSASLLPTFATILTTVDEQSDSPVYSTEIKTNVLTLVKLLVQGDHAFAVQISSLMGPMLRSLTTQTFKEAPTVPEQGQQVVTEQQITRTPTSSIKNAGHVSKRELENIFKGGVAEEVGLNTIHQALEDLLNILNI
jgi:hypothetical protein